MIDKADFNEYKHRVVADFNRRTNYDKGNNFHPPLANRLVELAELQSGQKILDIATGTGLVAIAAAQIVGSDGQVIGVDISKGMLEQAQRKVEAAGLQNVELQETDAEYLNFSDNSFDAILCSSAIVYLTDIPTSLRNWHRFLKKGGLVAFSCFAEKALTVSIVYRAVAQRYGIFLPNPNEPLDTPEKCHKMLREAGFKDIEVITEQFGFGNYISNAESAWDRNLNSACGNPLLQLSPEKLEQCKAEYIAELEALATDQGIWNDVTTQFVLSRK